jgi:hypothetical protein
MKLSYVTKHGQHINASDDPKEAMLDIGVDKHNIPTKRSVDMQVYHSISINNGNYFISSHITENIFCVLNLNS